MNSTFDIFVKEFYSLVTINKCPHCNKRASALRKEGYSKFFIYKNIKNDGDSSVINNAKPEDDEIFMVSDEEDKKDEDETVKVNKNLKSKDKRKQKFLNPIEVF
jgi:hypothetical protein